MTKLPKFELNLKTVGSLLVGFALILLFILIWVKVNVDAEESYLCAFVEKSPDLSMEECPAHDSNTSWLLLAGFGIAFLVLVSGFYMLFMPQREEKVEFSADSAASGHQKELHQNKMKEIDPASLSDGEKKVYELLQLSQGSKYQSDLIRETGMTKVKMSRLLDRLEGKGIIDRKRRGMTNIVVLK